ncbi:MAG: magnesium transporter MgtC [Candidatus Magasanikbacteria bacterium CG11_big_fil_rev_8_21_14_0_20_39_34]|uniref:Magnesium transporter MgtC n=1 Tax=Candidatus Magasanikbacteria bacterium CG11_big_fil_rev_8_21_14_0_20_39_34 TaxID=1974653 RepID=A0A2H0N6F1_9BACT|nr:MAG: magnesium transporter MgtC [Candidatus Magasanikbacteria bacterium CG11_big_fil_rev_8_21_14_0_20_39_34]
MDIKILITEILLSIFLGGSLGWQRQHIGKTAGFRTFAIITVASMLVTRLSSQAFGQDPARVAAQILTGIGFIGAGIIIHKKDTVEGLTTAAGFWAAAAIGMAIGAGWYIESIIVTISLFLLLVLPDKKIIK